ncbi:MAG: hypothetical protein C4K49_04435 [Candidatus Thorarchaeota archaeon]|nr:MAG: hypothetical protein C4K49_04435 [Candidatus Thorarchaeota archaeon]
MGAFTDASRVYLLDSLTLVKLGGSVITHKDSSPPTTNTEAISRVVRELKVRRGKLIVVLGGGAYGHQPAHQYGFGDPNTSKERLLAGIPSIRHNMALLSLEVDKAMQDEGIPGVVFSPFSSSQLHNGSIVAFPTGLIQTALEAGLIVITHGDVCFDDTTGASILSGDTILVYLAKELSAKSIYVGTDVDGVFEGDPKENHAARLVPVINRSNRRRVLLGVGSSRAEDVTGGMAKKVGELMKLEDNRPEIAVFNLCVPGRLESLLSGKPVVCTRITF